MKKNLLVDVHERPKAMEWTLLSFQHVFAMFGATILVPIITGYPVSVAIFASGVGTLLYTIITKGKVPVYLGSSFAYIGAVQIAIAAMGGDIAAAQSGLFLVGMMYVIVSLIVRFVGKDWLKELLPPIVIGPMIAVIGLSLASVAINDAHFIAGGDPRFMLVALITFLSAAFISTKAKGFFKIIPFLCAIVIGYVASIALGIVDFTPVMEASWFALPQFALPFQLGNFDTWSFHFGPETFAMLPVVFVTIAEHIGDHTVLGKICDKNFLENPGLENTLLGDGVATAVSAILGGPANTTYGENTGVIGLTKIGSVYVTAGAACIAIGLSFIGKISALISTIPTAVLGGMAILLYGVIASNGLRILIDAKVDFSKQRNLIIASAMLVIGLGGAILPIGNMVTLSGTALAAVVGVVLNFVLPGRERMTQVQAVKMEKENPTIELDLA